MREKQAICEQTAGKQRQKGRGGGEALKKADELSHQIRLLHTEGANGRVVGSNGPLKSVDLRIERRVLGPLPKIAYWFFSRILSLVSYGAFDIEFRIGLNLLACLTAETDERVGAGLVRAAGAALTGGGVGVLVGTALTGGGLWILAGTALTGGGVESRAEVVGNVAVLAASALAFADSCNSMQFLALSSQKLTLGGGGGLFSELRGQPVKFAVWFPWQLQQVASVSVDFLQSLER
ncbi:hypothetical protein TNIN_35231 [Trichonephila inaurata madagascariensis]|uniref:Uncharacterized protein n=1 Tax=Trichonephila inaurata madagascariensis TaxID=2747483 RepID=A0A8X6KKT7_9ARAC|nr:hypothetical protein TNIN_35231 [Trichonephila inaurata madagascariensis]